MKIIIKIKGPSSFTAKVFYAFDTDTNTVTIHNYREVWAYAGGGVVFLTAFDNQHNQGIEVGLNYNRPGDYVLKSECLTDGSGNKRTYKVQSAGLAAVDDPDMSHIPFSDAPDAFCPVLPPDITITSIEQEETGADITVTVNATSSYGPIEYSLNNSTWQTSNQFVFTPGMAGKYRAYVRDTLGYAKFEAFEIKFPTYGLKYEAEFDKDSGEIAEIKIYELDYAGSSTEVRLGGNPVVRRYMQEGDDKYAPIKGQQLTVSIFSEVNYQFQEFFTAEDKKFKAEFLVDGQVKFTGFITPEAYSEPYIDPPYEITVTFNDGLGLLKNRKFTDSTDEAINDVKSMMECVKICLQSTGLDLPIYTSISIYETSWAGITTESDPLRLAYVNTGAFLDKNGDPDKTCYDVLRACLEPFGSQIFQEDGIWMIRNIDEIGSTYYRRKYNFSGVYDSTDTYDPILELTSAYETVNRNVFTDYNQKLELKPAWKEVEVEVPTLKFDGLIVNSNFTQRVNNVKPDDWEDTFDILSSYVEGDNIHALIYGDGYSNSNTKYITSTPVNLTGGDDVRLTIKARVYVWILNYSSSGPSVVNFRFKVRLGGEWMSGNGYWGDEEQIIDWEVTPNTWVEINIDTQKTDATGALEIFIYQGWVNSSVADIYATKVDYFDVVYNQNNNPIPDKETFKTANEGKYIMKPEVRKLFFSDYVNVGIAGRVVKNCIFKESSGNQSAMAWTTGTDTNRLLKLLTNRILNNHRVPTQVITGNIIGDIKFSNIVTDPNNPGKGFMITALEIEEKYNTHRIELVELLTFEEAPLLLCENGEDLLMESKEQFEI